MGGRGSSGARNNSNNNQLAQIGGPDSYAWQFREEKLAQFKKDTGYTGEKAEKAYDLIQKYFGAVRADRQKLKNNELNSIIDDMVKYRGSAYRGIALTPSQFSQYKEGAEISLNNVSSWSSRQEVADEWANASAYNSGRHGDIKVIMVMENSKSGARAGYMGIHNEAEVLYKSTQKITILRKEKKGNLNYVYVRES